MELSKTGDCRPAGPRGARLRARYARGCVRQAAMAPWAAGVYMHARAVTAHFAPEPRPAPIDHRRRRWNESVAYDA